MTGGVEVQVAQQEFEVDGRRFMPGTYVVQMDQPYSAFAKTLLEAQHYPELREYEGGPLRPPYDVTAHTLTLLMDVEVVESAERIDVELSAPIEAPDYTKAVPGLTNRRRVPRVGLYESWVPSMDGGWTRWIFDEYGIEYQRLHDDELRGGRLGSRFDAIILPDQTTQTIIEGNAEGTMPPEYVGGIGAKGVESLRQFVESGGTLIAFNRASTLPIDEFALPVINTLEGLGRSEFYIPGSILRLNLKTSHWLAQGMPARNVAWAESALAFEPSDDAGGRVEIVGRYGTDELLLSGWISGAGHIEGRGAIAVVRYGRGRVVLFGFRPQYRGQAIATYPLVFNALKQSIAGAGAGAGAGASTSN